MEGTRTPARVDLCGQLRIEIDGQRRESGARGRQGRLLVAYLVLHRHAPISRERLVDALWSDELPRDPSAVLNTLLSGLRRALGEGRLEGRRELRIDLGPDPQVDVETAVAARDGGLDALARSRFAEAAEAAREAVRITERELLAGDSADWLDRVRDEVRAVRADALETLARASLELGGVALTDAVSAGGQLVRLEPFRESAYALLMEAHAARGDVAEALRVYDRVRTLLRDELGTAPAVPLLRLHERLVALEQAGDTREDEPPVALPAPLARDDGFVGRADTLERLRTALGEAAAGGRRFVVLAGDAGIGKTSLAARVAREAHAGGAAVLYGRSSEEPLLPYEPFVEALCQYIGTSPPEALEPAVNPELDELARWMPDLGRPPSQEAAAPAPEPETRRFRMFEAMVGLLARIGRDRPVVVVLDDLHWADGSALRLIRHLARATRPAQLLVLATYRDTEVEAEAPVARLLADLRREVALDEILLEGFDDAETAELIAARGGAVDAGLAPRLRELTAGNPFFLEEALRAITGREAGPGADRLQDLDPPRAVAETIGRRVGRLPAGGAEVLSAAAVLGMTFRLPVLEEIAGGDGTPVLAVVEEAVRARLVVELEAPGQRFSFAHELVRAALEDATSRTRRGRLHRRAGEVLEARREELGVGAAELAEHFFAARGLGEHDRALRYAREAAAHAEEAFAYEDAARHLERALAVCESAGDDDLRRCDVLLDLGHAQLRAGAVEARATFLRAAEAARGRSPERLARAAIGACGRYYEAGVVDDELAAVLEEALDRLDAPESPLRAQLLGRLGEVLHFTGEPERGLELTAAALGIARRLQDADALAGALAGRHVALLHTEHLAERLEVSAELCAIARARDRREMAVHARHARLYDLFERGDVSAARHEHDELKRLAAELRQPRFRAFASSWAVVWAQMEGRFAEAERLATELLELQGRLGDRDAQTIFAARVFAIRRDQGRLGELLPLVDGFIAEFPRFAPLRAALPLICLEAGEARRARTELRAIGAALPELPRDFFWLSAVSWVAEAAAGLGDRPVLATVRSLLEPYAERTVQLGFAACLGSAERLLGRLAAAEGDAATARARLERALERNGALGARTLVIRSQADLAEVLRDRAAGEDDAARADELAASALAGARELGMAGVAARLS